MDHNGPVTEPRAVHTWLTDMDGVLVREEDPIPGAKAVSYTHLTLPTILLV